MKKIVAILMVVVMTMGLGCAMAESTLGGWSAAEDNSITEENKAFFDKAVEGLIGVNYEPITYLGSQVVAGTNHCYLCKATVVYPDATPSYVLMYIYEALDGHTEILHIIDLDLGALAELADLAEETEQP